MRPRRDEAAARRRREELVALMADHRLTPRDVATLMGKPLDTIYMWRVATCEHPIPESELDRLRMKLAILKGI